MRPKHPPGKVRAQGFAELAQLLSHIIPHPPGFVLRLFTAASWHSKQQPCFCPGPACKNKQTTEKFEFFTRRAATDDVVRPLTDCRFEYKLRAPFTTSSACPQARGGGVGLPSMHRDWHDKLMSLDLQLLRSCIVWTYADELMPA